MQFRTTPDTLPEAQRYCDDLKALAQQLQAEEDRALQAVSILRDELVRVTQDRDLHRQTAYLLLAAMQKMAVMVKDPEMASLLQAIRGELQGHVSQA